MPEPLSKPPPPGELPEGRLGLPGAVNGLGEGGLRLLPVVPTGEDSALERACRPMAGLPAPELREPRPAVFIAQQLRRKRRHTKVRAKASMQTHALLG
jgi:hypothetical protein